VKIEQKFAVLCRGGTLPQCCYRPRTVRYRVRAQIFPFAMLAAWLRCAFGVGVTCEEPARSGDSEALIVEQALDLEDRFDVFAAIEPVTAWAFYRLQRRKFGFPVAQNKGLGRGKAADFADAEKSLVRRE